MTIVDTPIKPLGSDRFTVKACEGEQLVVGVEEARQTAQALARRLE